MKIVRDDRKDRKVTISEMAHGAPFLWNEDVYIRVCKGADYFTDARKYLVICLGDSTGTITHFTNDVSVTPVDAEVHIR